MRKKEKEEGGHGGKGYNGRMACRMQKRRGQEDNKLEPPGDAEDDMRSGGRDRARGRSIE